MADITPISKAASARAKAQSRPQQQWPVVDPAVAREIRMIPDTLTTADGRRMLYAVSDNEDANGPEGPGSPPIWAVNIHGYFAGGGMYWRESSYMASALGWRMLNPCLPGFAGSDALPEVGIEHIADQIAALMDHVGARRAVILGHSMGGAVAVQFATSYPDRTLGVIYRDGAATPSWKQRSGPIVSMLAPISPDMAGLADIMAAIALDMPDIFVGHHLAATLRGVWPDTRKNLQAMGRAIPVGSMLMSMDLSDQVALLAQGPIPVLPVWGCLDRITNAKTAKEFSTLVKRKVLWVPGGHSWMLSRPQGQADVLRFLAPGLDFVRSVEERREQSDHPRATVRPIRLAYSG